MQYKNCGISGVKLPLVSLGLWHNFGGKKINSESKKVLFKAFDCGITHFDLANNYKKSTRPCGCVIIIDLCSPALPHCEQVIVLLFRFGDRRKVFVHTLRKGTNLYILVPYCFKTVVNVGVNLPHRILEVVNRSHNISHRLVVFP